MHIDATLYICKYEFPAFAPDKQFGYNQLDVITGCLLAFCGQQAYMKLSDKIKNDYKESKNVVLKFYIWGEKGRIGSVENLINRVE